MGEGSHQIQQTLDQTPGGLKMLSSELMMHKWHRSLCRHFGARAISPWL